MGWFQKTPPPESPSAAGAAAGLTDLHSHVLFGLDDGARTIEESEGILDGLGRLGFIRVAATPHFDNHLAIPDVSTQLQLIESIAIQRQRRPPAVVTGAECVFDDIFLALESEGRVPRVGSGSAYLVEFGFFPGSVPPGVENTIFRFQLKECTLIAAHPERISDLQRDLARADMLHRAGMLFQMDVMSLVGKYGRIAERTAYAMLEKGIVDLAGTDIHRLDDLPWLERGLAALWEWDSTAFEWLFSTNPGLVLSGKAEEVGTDE